MKTEKGVYLPSKREDCIEALEKYCPGKTFLDLGSGDGRVMSWAHQAGAFNPRGVEWDDMATDIKGDLFCQDIDQYQVLFYYSLGCDYEEDLYRWLDKKYNGIFILNTKDAECSRYDVLGNPYDSIGSCLIYKLENKE